MKFDKNNINEAIEYLKELCKKNNSNALDIILYDLDFYKELSRELSQQVRDFKIQIYKLLEK